MMGMAYRWRALALLLISLGLAACNQQKTAGTAPEYSAAAPETGREMVLAVHPLHNPQKLNEVFGPLVKHLNQNIPGVHFRLEASRDYATFNTRLYGRQYQFALPNPYQTISAMKHGYHVIAKVGEDQDFRGIFIVRKDSGIREVADLKGKAVSYPAPTALAACMMPQYYLQTHGLNVMHDIENRYVGSQESSIMSAYLGNVAAGATWPPPWRAFVKQHPEKAEQLKAIWETPPLVNNSFMARDDIAPELVESVRKVLVSLSSHAEGKAILQRMETCCIDAANDGTYAPVVAFTQEFSRKVRPLDE